MIIKCTECAGTGHVFDDEGHNVNAFGCSTCDGLGEVEEDEEG
jgi:DnaJ-class molecular chaperone